MGRNAKGWLDAKTGRWFARLGDPDPKTGRATVIMLKDAHGLPIASDDILGRDAAVKAILDARSERARMGVTVAELCKQYIAYLIAEKRAPNTIKGAHYHLTRFARFEVDGVMLADRPAASITPADLWRYGQSGVGAVRNAYACVLACWRWAARPVASRNMTKLIPSNPLADIERPQKGIRTEVPLSWEFSRRMLRMVRGYARQRVRTRQERTRAARWIRTQALVGIAYSGARTAEMVTLEWTDIRWADSVAEVPVDRHKTRRTRRIRRFPILARFMRILRVIERWPHRHPKYVFACNWNKEANVREWWRWLREDVRPYLADRGLEIPDNWRPYWLRHHFSTTALEEVGEDLASIAMGNSKAVLRQVYFHLSAKTVRMVGQAVEKARKRRD